MTESANEKYFELVLEAARGTSNRWFASYDRHHSTAPSIAAEALAKKRELDAAIEWFENDSVGAECSRLESDMLDIHHALETAGLPGAINATNIIERIERLLDLREYPWKHLHAEAADPIRSIAAIVSYDWSTARRDYEEQGEPEGHIFEHLRLLDCVLGAVSKRPVEDPERELAFALAALDEDDPASLVWLVKSALARAAQIKEPVSGMPRSTTIHDREIAHQVISRALADDAEDVAERGLTWDPAAAATAALDALEAEASISTGEPDTEECPSCDRQRPKMTPGSVCPHCGHVEPDNEEGT